MNDISKLQFEVMIFVKIWANTFKTPIPHKEIIAHMENEGRKACSTKDAIASLLNKGYIRRGYSEKANRTLYVLIRNITIPEEYQNYKI